MGKRDKKNILKIALVGPESTGKSSLSKALAAHYNTQYVPEFAREYLATLERTYKEEDIELIAKGQLQLEKEKTAIANRFLFCDTTLLVTKIWQEYKFKQSNEWILKNYRPHDYSLHFLMNIDLPWEYDEQREHPHLREYFLKKYQEELEESTANYYIISGNSEQRIQRAISKIDAIYNSSL